MANSNFIVQNGLTVGPLTIDAATGSISTSGTVTVLGGLAVSTISKNDSSISINDTGTGSNVSIVVDGTVEHVITGSLATFATPLTVSGNISGTYIIGNGSQLTGLPAGYANSDVATYLAGSSVTTAIKTTGAINGASLTTTGDVTVGGNFTVNGTTTTINATTLAVTDLNITIAKDATTAASANGAGLTVGGTAAATMLYTSATDTWNFNKNIVGTLSTAAQTAITSVGTLTGLTVSGTLAASANNTINIGAAGTSFATVYATTFSGVSTTAKYADLAENYQADKAYTPGTVIMFGGSEEVTVADADTTAVAGIVSTNPAHLMNGGLTGANVVPLALQGRVPCNVIGPVKKGDMLVSAGYGFAKASKSPLCGQVIGKALNDFSGAKGQIEVVCGRV